MSTPTISVELVEYLQAHVEIYNDLWIDTLAKKSALERRVRNLQALLARERNSARAWREGAEALEAWNNRPHLEGCSAAQECTCDEEANGRYELTGEHDYWCPQSPHMGLECDCGRDA